MPIQWVNRKTRRIANRCCGISSRHFSELVDSHYRRKTQREVRLALLAAARGEGWRVPNYNH